MRSVIHIDPDALAEVVSMLTMCAVKVVGSAEDRTNVALTIEGEAVPDAPLVECTVMRVLAGNTMQVTMTFRAVNP
jgi:hypothetical protein